MNRTGTKSQRDRRTKGRGGYSFPEVMFAVVVLGIGFIMLAAIFPVAVKQSKLTGDETRALALARSVVGSVNGIAAGSDANDFDFYAWGLDQDRSQGYNINIKPPLDPVYANWTGPNFTMDNLPLHVGNSLFPATGLGTQKGAGGWFTKPSTGKWGSEPPPSSALAPGRVFGVYTQKGWDWLRGNTINDNDARYGWTVLYRRDGDPNMPPSFWSPVMQVYVIVSEVRGRSLFEKTDYGPDVGQYWTNWLAANPTPGAWSSANLAARYASVRVKNDYRNNTQPSDGPGVDSLQFDSKDTYQMGEGLAEGCYVVMSDTGKVYQLGPKVSADTWELVPGNDLTDSTENTTTGLWQLGCFVGRERTFKNNDPANNKPIFTGPAQDIYLYTAVVPIRKGR
jgi:hypothetical protein